MKYIFYIVLFSHLTTISEAMSEEKIWHVANQKFISEKTLIKNLAGSQNILLGIRQDNPCHHKYVAGIIGKLAKMGQKPVTLLSYVERSKQNAFVIFIQRHKGRGQNYDATGLDMLLDWPNSGQADWTIVKPVFDMAMLKKLPLKAINFSRHEIGQLHHDGLGGLPDDVKSDLLPLLSAPMKKKIKTRIMEELRKTYCDILPLEILENFALIRRAQNGIFALAMAKLSKETEPGTAVLITAQNHVLKDTGVPNYLDKLGSKGKISSLSFVESAPPSPETMPEMMSSKVDFIWYTEKISRTDPCKHQQVLMN